MNRGSILGLPGEELRCLEEHARAIGPGHRGPVRVSALGGLDRLMDVLHGAVVGASQEQIVPVRRAHWAEAQEILLAEVKRATAEVDTKYFLKPSDWLETIRFQLNTTPIATLLFVTPDQASEEQVRFTASGKPKYFTNVGTQIEVVPFM